MIIGISGKMGSGKDTVGSILSRRGFYREAFANRLRIEVDWAINAEMRLPDDCPVTILELETKDCWEKPTPPKMRALLQWWGTEYRRGRDPQYWINKLLFDLNPALDYVITDVRFPNEAAAIRSIGGKIWRMAGRESSPNGIPGHSSESFDFEPDLTLDNSGSIQNLEEQVYQCLKSLRKRYVSPQPFCG
jgi:hypothetical protein